MIDVEGGINPLIKDTALDSRGTAINYLVLNKYKRSIEANLFAQMERLGGINMKLIIIINLNPPTNKSRA